MHGRFPNRPSSQDGVPADAKIVSEEAHPITIADIEFDVIAEVLAALFGVDRSPNLQVLHYVLRLS